MRSGADNYTVYRFMTGELGLRGAELQVYALIYSFTVTGAGGFSGSRAYIAETVGVSVRTVDRALGELFSRGLIGRRTQKNGHSSFEYIAASRPSPRVGA